MTESRKPEDLVEPLNAVQRAAFNMADGWGSGLDITYAGIDLTAPMLYGLTSVFNQQLMSFLYPPVVPEEPKSSKHPKKARGKRKKKRIHE